MSDSIILTLDNSLYPQLPDDYDLALCNVGSVQRIEGLLYDLSPMADYDNYYALATFTPLNSVPNIDLRPCAKDILKKMIYNDDVEFKEISSVISASNSSITDMVISSAKILTDLTVPVKEGTSLILMASGKAYVIDDDVPAVLNHCHDILVNVKTTFSGKGGIVLDSVMFQELRDLSLASQYSALAYVFSIANREKDTAYSKQCFREIGIGHEPGSLCEVHRLICSYATNGTTMYINLTHHPDIVTITSYKPCQFLVKSIKLDIAKIGIHEAFSKAKGIIDLEW